MPNHFSLVGLMLQQARKKKRVRTGGGSFFSQVQDRKDGCGGNGTNPLLRI